MDLVLLIGFMRILSDDFCREWRDRILNVHPSLLPKYAGGMDMNVHEEVLKNNDKETGCTIHFVTDEVDGGPLLIQKKCDLTTFDECIPYHTSMLNSFIDHFQLVMGKKINHCPIT